MCCNELRTNGLLERHDVNYCMKRIALVPDVASPLMLLESFMDEGVIHKHANRDLRPIYYLAIDEAATLQQSQDIGMSYRQVRQVKARDEHKEKETLRDLYDHGITSQSPFHLAGFMPDLYKIYARDDGGEESESRMHLLPLKGNVSGVLSDEGGMHRSFQQRVSLSLDNWSISTTEMSIHATVFLPIMESIFIDADDPLIVEYERGVAEEILCKASFRYGNNDKDATTKKSKCSIQFIYPETIDIEQPSFASRQYVVAYQINATLDMTSSAASAESLQIAIDYGTTLHIRYLSPITQDSNGLDIIYQGVDGLVPIAIQHPILYSAGVSMRKAEGRKQHFALQQGENVASDPIIAYVAAGLDSDYRLVTLVTMVSALMGGLVLMRSMGQVSIWC